ncbi:hypothetical protein H4219_004815 [Mycoemilia scoparia]|uniref:Uncharacterized protein n=1 Tax=Mycoemilia scoparia TaxID=417184 RepID=A0A9W8DR90_9FUNG|nr:hypothetical protein H4219_004815 [Mycoemilia scoparia]
MKGPTTLESANPWYIDFYGWLGVSPTATKEDLQRAYVPWAFLASTEDPRMRVTVRKKIHAYQVLSNPGRLSVYTRVKRARTYFLKERSQVGYHGELKQKLESHSQKDTDDTLPYWSKIIGDGNQSSEENYHYIKLHEELLFYQKHLKDSRLCQDFYEHCIVFDQKTQGEIQSKQAHDSEIVATLKLRQDIFYTGMVETDPVHQLKVCPDCNGRSPLTYCRPCSSCFPKMKKYRIRKVGFIDTDDDCSDDIDEFEYGADLFSGPSKARINSFQPQLTPNTGGLAPCYICQGLGDVLICPYVCNTCSGTGSVWVERKHIVNVSGMASGDRIFIKDGGHEVLVFPKDKPIHDSCITSTVGPLILVLDELPNKNYRRICDDLFCEIKLGHSIAENGGHFYMNFLGNEIIAVQVPPKELLGSLLVPQKQYTGKGPRGPITLCCGKISNKGMPRFKTKNEYGDLFIRFHLYSDSDQRFKDVESGNKSARGRSKSFDWYRSNKTSSENTRSSMSLPNNMWHTLEPIL